jgi:hypothetical protein
MSAKGQKWTLPAWQNLLTPGQTRSPMHAFLPAPTSNGMRFPYLASLLGPEGKSHVTWHRASSSSPQGKGASRQLCSGEPGC